LGLILAIFYWAFLTKLIKGNAKVGYWLLSGLLLFIVCGFNEVLTLLMSFILGLLTIVSWKHQTIRKKISFQFLLCLLFTALVVFSPGNAYRQAAYENAHQFFYSSLYSMLQVGRFTLLWVGSIPLLVGSIFFISWLNKEQNSWTPLISNYLNRWISLVLLLVVVFICVFPPYWSTGMLGQHRTLNIAYYFFILMWFVNLMVWHPYLGKIKLLLLNGSKRTLFWIVILIGIIGTRNGYYSLKDIFTGDAYQFDEQLKTRFNTFENEAGASDKEIVIQQIRTKPKTLFVTEITNNPDDWVTQGCYAFFEIEDKKILIVD
jgi:hypothetical protein